MGPASPADQASRGSRRQSVRKPNRHDIDPAPQWCVKSPEDHSAYVSEARGMWLYAVA
ncbi:DUF6758 family protein [Actinoplanes sp. ATCC 53533]|uniref:DUF6758 family protein n=1 Tax=Actinoplanes sp. ATCC 53533 TaxID=1288362 RepID=UPI00351390AE